eukprot:gene9552-9628_t
MTRWRADMLLLLTAFIWGTAFVAQKVANETMGPSTFVGVRFLISAAAMVPFMVYEARRQVVALHRKDWWIALVISLCLFFGAMLQQIGMLTTTATNAGFLTALYVVCVPLVVWVLLRERPKGLVVIACAVSVLGAYLLTENGQAKTWALGDGLMLVADLAWALGIALVPVFLNRMHRPYFLSCLQFGITGTLALGCGLMFEPQNFSAVLSAWPALLYTAIISGSLAYTMQIVAQKYAPAAEAALILSLESVFAAIAGAVLLNERLSLLATLGCALILLGVVLVEVGPSLLKGRNIPKNA